MYAFLSGLRLRPMTTVARASTQDFSLLDYCRWKARVIRRDNVNRAVHLALSLKRRVYIGASTKYAAGWETFNKGELDVTKRTDFMSLFCVGEVGAFLSEHTFEHISLEGMEAAFNNFFEFLSDGGYVRTAIPSYRRGHTATEHDNKIGHINFSTADDLVTLMKRIGYSDVQKLEWTDFDSMTVHTTAWDVCEGQVIRSAQYDRRNQEFLRANCKTLNRTYSADGSLLSSALSENSFPASDVRVTSTIVQGFKRT